MDVLLCRAHARIDRNVDRNVKARQHAAPAGPDKDVGACRCAAVHGGSGTANTHTSTEPSITLSPLRKTA